MKKKTLAMLIALMLVLVVGVGGTLAWLKVQTPEVKNTFTPSNIDIKLVESDDLDLQMVPGSDIKKDPKVTVLKGSEKCYLFVEVIQNDAVDEFLEYSIDSNWTAVQGETNVYYRIVETEQMGTDFSVLSGDIVTVKGDVEKSDMDALRDGATAPELTFIAYAVQYENIFDSGKTDAENAAYAWTQAK